jgi:hypothetical protein
MSILKNHNKELKKNLIKQVAINKMQAKFTISISQSLSNEGNTRNPSMLDAINSFPSSMKSSSQNSIDHKEMEL